MKLSKCTTLALNILLHSKLRSWLTIIGIVIGVAAVVAIVSIGEGLQQNVQNRLGGLGADILTIAPGGQRASGGFRGFNPAQQQTTNTISTTAKNLTQRDIQTLRLIEGITLIHGTVTARGEAYYLSEKSTVSIEGIDPLIWKDITTAQLEQGRFLGSADYAMVVVGARIAKNTFKQPLALNRMIDIEKKPFKIVGILKETGAGGEDNKVFMPLRAARDTFETIGNEKIDTITLKAAHVDDVDRIMNETDQKLMIARHLTDKKKDYTIRSAKQTQENIASITQTISLFLGAIAAVSLIVGAVGIANTLFTSVLEKTKEIGIMKAIGAQNKDILLIFLLNAGFVGMTGGILGILLGSVVSLLIPRLGIRLIGPGGGGQMITVLSPRLLIFSLLLAILIGMLAGAVPAYRASKLKPVDALRYE